MNHKTLIVYQDGRPDLERTALSLHERLGSKDREAVVKPASQITIPEILATSLFIFGADEPEAKSYAEIVRVLSGINLASRRVAFFGADGASVAWLKNMVSDSELAQVGTDLLGSKPDPAAIAAWVRSIS